RPDQVRLAVSLRSALRTISRLDDDWLVPGRSVRRRLPDETVEVAGREPDESPVVHFRQGGRYLAFGKRYSSKRRGISVLRRRGLTLGGHPDPPEDHGEGQSHPAEGLEHEHAGSTKRRWAPRRRRESTAPAAEWRTVAPRTAGSTTTRPGRIRRARLPAAGTLPSPIDTPTRLPPMPPNPESPRKRPGRWVVGPPAPRR